MSNNLIYVFWTPMNWLEFVTYVIIPSAIVLVILLYIFFNIRLLKLSFDYDLSLLPELDKLNNLKFERIYDILRKKNIDE